MNKEFYRDVLREQRLARRSFREQLPLPLRTLSRLVIPEKAHLDGLYEVVQDSAVEAAVIPGRSYTVGVWNSARNAHSDSLRYLDDLLSTCDVVMLQELRLSEEVRSLFAQFPVYAIASRHFWLDADRRVSTGNCTVSRIRPFCEPVVHEGPHEPWFRSPKTIIQLELPYMLGESVTFENVHGFNFGSAKRLREQLDALAINDRQHGRTAVLGGDFNTRNPSRTRVLNEVISSREFTPVIFDSPVTSLGPWKLDGLYVRDVYKVVSSRTVPVRRSVSDHTILYTELVF